MSMVVFLVVILLNCFSETQQKISNSKSLDDANNQLFRTAKYVERECKTDEKGFTYNGKISVTKSGRTCQAWNTQTPNDHSGKFQYMHDQRNYCRNPDGMPYGPWCYTTDPKKRWEYCGVPFCAKLECKVTTRGMSYKGTKSVTTSGRKCQSWKSKKPHKHDINIDDHNKNYCRNPDGEPNGPWCYTTDPKKRWEYCDVNYCDSRECKTDQNGKSYKGRLSITESGKTCQAWKSQTPHSHKYFGLEDDGKNYCRNPDIMSGPWCYTTDPDVRWEYCSVPRCGPQ